MGGQQPKYKSGIHGEKMYDDPIDLEKEGIKPKEDDITTNRRLVEEAQKEQGTSTLTQKEKQHQYYLKYKEKQKAYHSHPEVKEKKSKYMKESYQENKERILAQQKEYKKKRREERKQTKIIEDRSRKDQEEIENMLILKAGSVELTCPETIVTIKIAIQLLEFLLERFKA